MQESIYLSQQLAQAMVNGDTACIQDLQTQQAQLLAKPEIQAILVKNQKQMVMNVQSTTFMNGNGGGVDAQQGRFHPNMFSSTEGTTS